MRIGISLYSLRARVWPAVLVAFPLILILVVTFPDQLAGIRGIGALAASAGLLYLVAHVSRDLGRRLEPGLFTRWGGPPTTILLRHRGPLSEPTRQRYHKTLGRLVPGMELPSAEEEHNAPERADEVYASCTRFLLEVTRDEKVFNLVAEENASYGFRRNALALRPLGIVVSALSVLVAVYLLRQPGEAAALLVLQALAAVVGLGMFLFWWRCVSPGWVKRAGDVYAERLLGACDLIQKQEPA